MAPNGKTSSPVVVPSVFGDLSLGDVLDRVEGIVRDLSAARVVFGSPVVAEGHTVIPVARVGAGLGGSLVNVLQRLLSKGPQVISGGGGLSAEPIGFIDISADGTTFVPIDRGLHQAGTPSLKAALPTVIGLVLDSLTPRRKG